MGTRALTFVYDGDKPIVNLYRQYDGYPTGHGAELAQFLDGFKIVNGIGAEKTRLYPQRRRYGVWTGLRVPCVSKGQGTACSRNGQRLQYVWAYYERH